MVAGRIIMGEKKRIFGSKISAFRGSTGRKSNTANPYLRWRDRENRIVEAVDSKRATEMVFRAGTGWVYV